MRPNGPVSLSLSLSLSFRSGSARLFSLFSVVSRAFPLGFRPCARLIRAELLASLATKRENGPSRRRGLVRLTPRRKRNPARLVRREGPARGCKHKWHPAARHRRRRFRYPLEWQSSRLARRRASRALHKGTTRRSGVAEQPSMSINRGCPVDRCSIFKSAPPGLRPFSPERPLIDALWGGGERRAENSAHSRRLFRRFRESPPRDQPRLVDRLYRSILST